MLPIIVDSESRLRLMNSVLLSCARCVGFTFGVRSCMKTRKYVPVQIKIKSV